MATNRVENSKLFRYSDIIVAVAVITLVMMMIIPVPARLLDFFLTFNITFSLVVLLVSMFTLEPLEFSVFPSLLLIMTMFRLSLNVSSTRLVLLHAYAGDVIQKFGDFVIGGNAVVGFVIFLILVVIQFIVITRGAERVSEVAARFTLDAMPGKQMAIDADLNAGLINDVEARKRRKDIQREADFYGAMDGASKFVKGDAIAGIIIILINILGGFIIGVAQKGMDLTAALHTYTILTVGDGLVTQIPALLVSTATGIIITRAASESNLGQDLSRQLLAHPKVLGIAAGVLFCLGLIGLPRLPLFAMAGVMGTMAYSLNRSFKSSALQEAQKEREQELEEVKKPENVLTLLSVDPMELELGYSLVPLVDASQGGDLLDRVVMIRRQCALDLGIVVPPIRMRDNMQLKPNIYVIKIKGVEVAQGELMIDHYLAISPGVEDPSVAGFDAREPAFGLPAKWIPASMREKAEVAGYTVVDLPSVVATHLTEVIRSHAVDILSRQDVQTLVEHVKELHPAVVGELIPDMMTIGEVQKVLTNLLRERVSVRDMVTILETLADYGRITKDPDLLTEYVRQALGRQIIQGCVGDNNVLSVISLDPKVEQAVRDSLQRSDFGSYLAIDPRVGQEIIARTEQELGKAAQKGVQPVVLCAPVVRFYFRRLTEKVLPGLAVLSYNELSPNLEVESIGMVSLS